MNHVVNDGMSTSHFINSLAEISRGSCHQISVPPTIERLFPNGTQRPVQFPFIIKTLFWTGQKELWPIYLGPILLKSHIPRLTTLLASHPFLARGCMEQARPVSTNHNVSLHVPTIISLAVTLSTIP